MINETDTHYNEFLTIQEHLTNEYRNYYVRFEGLWAKLIVRDKGLEKFKHYYDKVDYLKKDKSTKE